MSFAIHLRTSLPGFASGNIFIVARINELKSSFCAIFSHRFGRYQDNYLPQFQWSVMNIHLTASWLGKYPPTETSTSENSCLLK